MASKASTVNEKDTVLSSQLFLVPIINDPVKERVLRLILITRETLLSKPAQQGIEWLQSYLPKAFKDYSWTQLLKNDVQRQVQLLQERLKLHLLPGSQLMLAREQYYLLVQACQKQYNDPMELARVDFQRSRCKKIYTAVLKKIEQEVRDHFNKTYPKALTEYDLLFDEREKELVISKNSLECIVKANITTSLLNQSTLAKEALYKYIWVHNGVDQAINEALPAESTQPLEKHLFEHYINKAKAATLEQPEHPLYARVKLFADIQTLQSNLVALHKLAFDILNKASELKIERKKSPRMLTHIARKHSIDATSLARLSDYASKIKTSELKQDALSGLGEVIEMECEPQLDAPKQTQKLRFDFNALQQASHAECQPLFDLASKYRDLCHQSKGLIEAIMQTIPADNTIDQQPILLILQTYQTQLIALDSITSTMKP